jgi:hypothetical protein
MSVSYDARICSGCEALIPTEECVCPVGTYGEKIGHKRATSININSIVDNIIYLTDNLKDSKESHEAWSKIQKALSYLSARDTMIKIKEGQ